MKSVLLGGLKVFLVNDGGKPLSAPGGRAKFFVAGTSTPEPVYSDIDLTEATALGPVVYTDELGYLPAIWLKTDRLYKVRVEQKLPGTPEVWSLLWEVDNVGYLDPHEIEEPGEPQITVDSITALKAVDHSAHSVVMVDGYYSAGDFGTPSTFVWSATSTRHDDGGSVIRPNDVASGDAGRWLQVFSGDVIDVRKFGAIPDLTENSDVTAKVVNAINYAQQNSTRSRPLTVAFLAPGKYEFGGDFDFTQYADFVDLSDNSHHKLNWLICEDVVFKGDNSDFTLSNNTVCLTREALIEGTNATLSVEGGGSIVVDPVWWGTLACTLDGNFVRCSSLTTNNKSFTACSVESTGKLGGSVYLTDMDFKQSWFDDSYDFSNLTIGNVGICLHDCLNPNDYIRIINALTDNGSIPNPTYGNLNSYFISDVELKDGFIIENALFNNVTLKGSGIITNCNGSITKDSSAINELTIRSSALTFKPNSSHEFDYVGILDISDSKISGESSYTKILTNQLMCHDSVLNVRTKIHGPIDIEGCTVTYDIEQKAVESSGTYSLDGKIIDCGITSHVLLTDDTGTNTVVNIVWKDNASSAATPINVSAIISHVKTSGSAHAYINEGNIGTFLPSSVSDVVTISDFGIDSVGNIDAMAAGTKVYIVDALALRPGNNHYYNAIYVELANTYNMFSIGANESFIIEIFVDAFSRDAGHSSNEPEFMDIIVPVSRVRTTNDGTINLSAIKGYVAQYIYEEFGGTIQSVSANVSIRRKR